MWFNIILFLIVISILIYTAVWPESIKFLLDYFFTNKTLDYDPLPVAEIHDDYTIYKSKDFVKEDQIKKRNVSKVTRSNRKAIAYKRMQNIMKNWHKPQIFIMDENKHIMALKDTSELHKTTHISKREALKHNYANQLSSLFDYQIKHDTEMHNSKTNTSIFDTNFNNYDNYISIPVQSTYNVVAFYNQDKEGLYVIRKLEEIANETNDESKKHNKRETKWYENIVDEVYEFTDSDEGDADGDDDGEDDNNNERYGKLRKRSTALTETTTKSATKTTTDTESVIETSSVPKKKALICVFIGGAFMFCHRKQVYGMINECFKRMPDFDIAILNYPTRFKYTLTQTLLSINKSIEKLTKDVKYSKILGLGNSAGVLLMGAFQHKELNKTISEKIKVPQINVQFDAMVSVCGLLSPNFDNPLVRRLFSFYMTRGTEHSELYTFFGLNSIPKLLISSEDDFLVYQTRRYVELEPCEYYIAKKGLHHNFLAWTNLEESQKMFNLIAAFFKKQFKSDISS